MLLVRTQVRCRNVRNDPVAPVVRVVRPVAVDRAVLVVRPVAAAKAVAAGLARAPVQEAEDSVAVVQVAHPEAHLAVHPEVPVGHPVELPVAAAVAVAADSTAPEAAAMQPVHSVGPVGGPRVVASPSGPSVKSSTTWKPPLLAAFGCRAVVARASGCPAVRR